MTSTTALYRHFDGRGRLLYVGISLSPLGRHREHAQTAAWIDQVARVTIERFATRAEAQKAEREAVQTEKPRCNTIRYEGRKKPTLLTEIRRFIPRRRLILDRVCAAPAFDFATIAGSAECLMIDPKLLRSALDVAPGERVTLTLDDLHALADRLCRGTLLKEPPWKPGSSTDHLNYKPSPVSAGAAA